ncbi:MAG: adenine phosphoribosyltransferase [Thermoguttaceae bacterium]|nr:adenine phosphoribosyltransferase [Thermoguttaceae bacterium]MDW8039078.1 adenine phosphoribosyltransferase [Thermoguttaceae bacterium]
MDLSGYIRSIPDFPKPGILFRDITPLLRSAEAFREAVRRLAEPFRTAGIQVVAAAEARGFLFAGPVALELGVGVVPIRKPGKLPWKTISWTYQLEYGTDTLQMHADAVSPGQRVLVLDDVLATGGTVEACCRMIEQAGGQVAGCAFLVELRSLGGRNRLEGYPVFSLIQYD